MDSSDDGMDSLSSFGHWMSKVWHIISPGSLLVGVCLGKVRSGKVRYPYPYMRWSSFVFLDPISVSNRRFHLHLATFPLTIRGLPVKMWGDGDWRARGLLCEAVALAGRVSARKRLIEGIHYSESQQVSSLEHQITIESRSSKMDLKRPSSPHRSYCLLRPSCTTLGRSEGKRRLTDRMGCTRLAGSTMA